MQYSAAAKGVRDVTSVWAKQHLRELKEVNAFHRRADVMLRRIHAVTIKEAAFRGMRDAYMKASADGTLPANPRQIMYAARPEILRATGKEVLDDAYFTQTLLPDI